MNIIAPEKIRLALLFLFLVSPIAAAKPKSYNLYFGETHNHTIFSFDYKGPEENSEPKDAYAHARSLGFHFFAVTDHTFDRLDKGMYREGLKQAAEATEDGKFVALYGQEFNKGATTSGHANIFDAPTLFGWEDPDVSVSEGDWEGFYKAVLENPGEFGPAAQFNHPYAPNFDDFSYDKIGDKVMKLVETSNGFPESHEEYHETIQKGLSKGWHLGFSASDDWHDHGWGEAHPETTGLFAAALTKKDVVEAIQARRTYGMNDTNAYALFMANGHWMGEIFDDAYGQLKFFVKIKDTDSGEGVREVVFYYGVPGNERMPKALRTFEGKVGEANLFRFEHTQPAGTTFYYYPRVTQMDGDFIILSPVWITVP